MASKLAEVLGKEGSEESSDSGYDAEKEAYATDLAEALGISAEKARKAVDVMCAIAQAEGGGSVSIKVG